jgi:hypothetical protein
MQDVPDGQPARPPGSLLDHRLLLAATHISFARTWTQFWWAQKRFGLIIRD